MSGWIGSEWPLSALGRRKRLAGMASAFEKRRIGPDRPEWVDSDRPKGGNEASDFHH
jgi:hypothetical protein